MNQQSKNMKYNKRFNSLCNEWFKKPVHCIEASYRSMREHKNDSGYYYDPLLEKVLKYVLEKREKELTINTEQQ